MSMAVVGVLWTGGRGEGGGVGGAYILMPSCWLSCDSVFLMRSAVRRAAPLAYQHSLMILAMTRSAWGGGEGGVSEGDTGRGHCWLDRHTNTTTPRGEH